MSAATSKTIFLDSFVFIKAFKDASLRTKLQNYLTAQGRVLVVNAVSLIEIYGSSGLAGGTKLIYRIRKAQMSSPCFSAMLPISRFS